MLSKYAGDSKASSRKLNFDRDINGIWMKQEFLERAINLAIENVASHKGGPFGAVIVKDGKIIAEGVNRVTDDCDPTAHAEIRAIRAAARALNDFHLEGCEIYSSCEPCPMCFSAIYWAHLDCVYYASDAKDAARAGFDDAFIYEELKKDPEKRRIPFRKVELGGAKRPFEDWLADPERNEY